MSGRPHVLQLTYYYPPAVGIASERMAAFHRHLTEGGWDVTVLTPEEPHFHRSAATDPGPTPTVRRLPAVELSRIVRSLWTWGAGSGQDVADSESTQVAAVPTNSAGELLRRFVRNYVYVPDAQVGWIPAVVRAGAEIIATWSAGGGLVYSSSVPYSSHLAAAELARRFHLPWVAEFRDPWASADPSMRPTSAWRRSLDERMEAWIVRRATRVVVTAESTRGIFLAAYPGLAPEKFVTVPSGTELAQVQRAPSAAHPLTLVHAGALHDVEYGIELLGALRELTAEGHAVRLKVVGDATPWRRALAAAQTDALDWIEWTGIVEAREAFDHVCTASVSVLCLHDRFANVISGKLLTYLGARRPILAHVPEGSEMDRILAGYDGTRMVRPWSAAGIADALRRLLADHRAGRIQRHWGSEPFLSQYTWARRAGELAQVFESALGTWRGR